MPGPEASGPLAGPERVQQCSAVSVSSTSEVTGPSMHSIALVSSKSASVRLRGHSENSTREWDNTPYGSTEGDRWTASLPAAVPSHFVTRHVQAWGTVASRMPGDGRLQQVG
jgi:hypothetical protein